MDFSVLQLMLYMHFPKCVCGCGHVFFVPLPTYVMIESFRSSWSFGIFRDIAYKIYRKQLTYIYKNSLGSP